MYCIILFVSDVVPVHARAGLTFFNLLSMAQASFLLKLISGRRLIQIIWERELGFGRLLRRPWTPGQPCPAEKPSHQLFQGRRHKRDSRVDIIVSLPSEDPSHSTPHYLQHHEA